MVGITRFKSIIGNTTASTHSSTPANNNNNNKNNGQMMMMISLQHPTMLRNKNILTFGLCALTMTLLCYSSIFLIKPYRKIRNTSIYLGDGDCIWTDSVPLSDVNHNNNNNEAVYGTLFASYPASGMRVTWQQTEGITGIRVLDDFFQLAYPKMGLVKTQYPHYEGIWSYGQNMNQVILVIRNPRWALPSYLTILSELNYAHTWELAYDHLPEVFTVRAPMEDWIQWRDYRFRDELQLWGYHIDFYMENGAQYWMPYDFERNGQWPFRFYNTTEVKPQDYHCTHDIDSCYPKAIISYERLKDPVVGASELTKVANALRDKSDQISVMDEDGINCIWHDTWVNTMAPNNDARDDAGLPRTAYNFTMDQMLQIEDKLVEYRNKYSSGVWVSNPQAQDLVTNFENYIGDVREEIRMMEANPPPTQAPDPNYEASLVEWYNSKGKGNRYDKAKVQQMGIWDLVKHFYD